MDIIVCLDFDDCIIPWVTKTEEGYAPNSKGNIIKETKKNVSLINKFCRKHKIKVFVTSSWSALIEYNPSKGFFIPKKYSKFERQLFKYIKKLPLIGVDPYFDRIRVMRELRDKYNCGIICIDDYDLSNKFVWDKKFLMLNVVNGEGLEDKLKEAEKWIDDFYEKKVWSKTRGIVTNPFTDIVPIKLKK
jgi:hypothetical protein